MIRPAVAADVLAVAVLEAELFGADAWSAGQVREELTGPGRTAWVAEEAAVPIGYVVTRTVGEVADLQRIGVAPAARRRGLARELLATALAAAEQSGVDRMLLEVSAINLGALAFYAAEGFTEISRRRSYYRDGSDALVLARELGGG